ncbi:threonine--tRNA ligase [Candidatus Mycoplasma haematominutum]|uniref:Threonine--tRNA ligase n=1 Tax=Candidatus Mycoplasma haematominutum 'Birmingham 1' TaxID=1116213 RepID=G8C3X2_9MOLU|nr:threonine--tRNA ligase [Candidatus Mycoplasma haematominutum]CCE67020.1 threonyl-tRNA synthetase [Candidatus Mycoplasma haematominutum 'Birmingham 1']
MNYKKEDEVKNSPTLDQDHRKLGLDKGLFRFPQEGGSGLPFWLPRGYVLIEVIKEYVNNFQESCGIQLVRTPLLGKKQLYLKTGHLSLYADNIFEPVKEDEEEFVLRPMTCPHHILLAKEVIQGYRQLPYAIGENSVLHRHEYSGGLIGLKRVRSMELIDTHIFCLENQCEESIEKALSWIWKLLQQFQVEIAEIVLATRSEKSKYLIEHEEWKKAEEILFGAARKWAFARELYPKLSVKMGEAAFYGPKIDFNVIDPMGQTFTISTLQLDTLMCEKLDFQIYDPQQNLVSPWTIHLGLIGTLERFTAYLLERWGGNLPFWLAPVQVVIIPVEADKYLKECRELMNNLKRYDVRVEIDSGKDRFQKKLFNAAREKIAIQILFGEREASRPSIVSFRQLGAPNPRELPFPEFVDYIRQLIEESKKY